MNKLIFYKDMSKECAECYEILQNCYEILQNRIFFINFIKNKYFFYFNILLFKKLAINM